MMGSLFLMSSLIFCLLRGIGCPSDVEGSIQSRFDDFLEITHSLGHHVTSLLKHVLTRKWSIILVSESHFHSNVVYPGSYVSQLFREWNRRKFRRDWIASVSTATTSTTRRSKSLAKISHRDLISGVIISNDDSGNILGTTNNLCYLTSTELTQQFLRRSFLKELIDTGFKLFLGAMRTTAPINGAFSTISMPSE